MGDDDGPPLIVLKPGLRYRVFQPCDPAQAGLALAMIGQTVPFSMEGKYVGQARVVGADPVEAAADIIGDGIMFTCELTSLAVN